jgi:hypothetical protein
MAFPVQIIRIDGGWKATATLIPIFYTFGVTAMDAATSFSTQYGYLENINHANGHKLSFLFNVIRVLDNSLEGVANGY